MKHMTMVTGCLVLLLTAVAPAQAQFDDTRWQGNNFFEIPARWLVDCPTAGTLPKAHWNVGTRIYPGGGTMAAIDIGLSNRMMLGISYGGEKILSNDKPDWYPNIEFSLKFRVVDEQEYFPAITVGFSSQGDGAYNTEMERYTFKSRGFYGVVSRSFYFYNWTAGGHAGLNYSIENDVDGEEDINLFVGFDATFRYNLALMFEWDSGLNDDRSTLPDGRPYVFSGKGRGYFNSSIKWLFTENLELELLLKDLFVNRRESSTLTREIRITYVDRF